MYVDIVTTLFMDKNLFLNMVITVFDCVCVCCIHKKCVLNGVCVCYMHKNVC